MRSYRQRISPCLTCTRVKNPRECNNKFCHPWRQWFLGRWELIHNYPREKMEQAKVEPVGVPLGGRHYATPTQVEQYRNNDPCGSCVCADGLCSTPCRLKRNWEAAKKEVFL